MSPATSLLDARNDVGEDATPLLRSLAGGLLGAALALVIDRLWPSSQLAVFDPLRGDAVELPLQLALPAIASELLTGVPDRTGVGIAAISVRLTLLAFVYTYGCIRRFLPLGDVLRGLIWGGLVWMTLAPSLLPRTVAWLAAGIGASAPPASVLWSAQFLMIESLVCLLAYGAVVGALNPARSHSGRQGLGFEANFFRISLFVFVISGCVGKNATELPGDGRSVLAPKPAASWHEGLSAMPAYRAEPVRVSGRYARDCARCHGHSGDGKGAFGRAMVPPPTDFTDRAYLRRQRPSYYQNAIVNGVTGTGMPSWGHALRDEASWDMTFYVWSLAVPSQERAEGRTLYQAHCERCHAADGAGVAERSFQDPSRVGGSRSEDEEGLSQAHPQLATSLDEAEREALIEYLWSFLYDPPALQDSGR